MTPLIRTEGKTYQTGYALSVSKLLMADPLLVESRDTTARQAETALGLPPSLYFYVGHACPAFGDIVLVYEFERLSAQGSASDHDTGGLFAGFVHFAPELSAAKRLEWSRQAAHRWPLSQLLQRFSQYLTDHFQSAAAYLTGQRAAGDDDAGRLLHPQNERRAWSVEVRLEQDHPLLDGVRLIGLAPAAFEAIRDATTTSPGAHLQWERLLDDGAVRAFDPVTMHADIEQLVAKGALP